MLVLVLVLGLGLGLGLGLLAAHKLGAHVCELRATLRPLARIVRPALVRAVEGEA